MNISHVSAVFYPEECNFPKYYASLIEINVSELMILRELSGCASVFGALAALKR